MGKVFNRGLDKDDDKKEGRKTNKTKDHLIYNSKHSFYKYRLSEFIKISSIDSKFNKIEECYHEIIALTDVDAEPENVNISKLC